MLPAIAERYIILGIDFMEMNTENIILKNKRVLYDEKMLKETREQ